MPCWRAVPGGGEAATGPPLRLISVFSFHLLDCHVVNAAHAYTGGGADAGPPPGASLRDKAKCIICETTKKIEKKKEQAEGVVD